jgi:hypothetical protein
MTHEDFRALVVVGILSFPVAVLAWLRLRNGVKNELDVVQKRLAPFIVAITGGVLLVGTVGWFLT